MQLNKGQQLAVEQYAEWYKYPHKRKRPWFEISGAAGTGKTTVARIIGRLFAEMKILSEKEVFSPIMLMPYLPNEEISVDCLKTTQGIIMVPRVKGATRVEEIRYDEEILSTCRDFFENK